jgi:23S rRNA pseudoU1915 N3-methylase RlmH
MFNSMGHSAFRVEFAAAEPKLWSTCHFATEVNHAEDRGNSNVVLVLRI